MDFPEAVAFWNTANDPSKASERFRRCGVHLMVRVLKGMTSPLTSAVFSATSETQAELNSPQRERQKCFLSNGKSMAETERWEFLAQKSRFRASRLASLCNVSLRTVQRHFSKQYGTTVVEWLRTVRMQDAYVRLKNAESVKEVALDLGYTQLSNFSRDFKQFYGFSPSLLRRPGPLWSFK